MKFITFLAGVLCGAVIFGGGAALAAGVTAQPSSQTVYVDGRRADMAAYNIGGSNYVKLRDVGRAVGFNVYWDAAAGRVGIDSAAPYTGEAPRSAAPAETGGALDGMVARTNALRRENGLAALEVHPLLMEAAQVRAEEMAAAGVYSHTRPDGSAYHTVTDSAGLAENLHRLSDAHVDRLGGDVAQAVLAEWADSAGHRANLLGEGYTHVGVGLARGTNASGQPCWYCVQLFLCRGYEVSWVDTPAA